MKAEALPERIGRYRVVGEIGRGAMGRVYLALDPNLERRVALKVMWPGTGEDPEETEELRQRFLLEARAAGRLAHPGIVAVHDAGTDPDTGLPYLAMELVEGESLEGMLRRVGRLPALLAVDLAARVARALGYAHARGIVHRDVKPANILLADDGAAKIADFGIAKLGGLGVTRAGRVLGSPFFMSPEQVRGLAVDGRSDLFSLGGVLYRALTGELPFPGDGLVTVAFKVVEVDPRPIDTALGLPQELLEVLARAMAKNPGQRYGTAEEMAGALEAVAHSLAGPAHASAGIERPASPISPEGAAVLPPSDPSLAHGATLRLEEEGLVATGAGASRFRSRRRALARRRLFRRVAGGLFLVAAGALGAWWAQSGLVPLRPRAAAGAAAAPTAGAGETATVVPARESIEVREEEPPPLRGREIESVAPSVAAATPQRTAQLDLAYRNRLGEATLSVRVDGRPVWSRELRTSRNPIRRTFGDPVVETFAVPAGLREIEVRVVGRSMAVDAAATIAGRFEAGGRRTLRVVLNPYSERVKLSWVPE